MRTGVGELPVGFDLNELWNTLTVHEPDGATPKLAKGATELFLVGHFSAEGDWEVDGRMIVIHEDPSDGSDPKRHLVHVTECEEMVDGLAVLNVTRVAWSEDEALPCAMVLADMTVSNPTPRQRWHDAQTNQTRAWFGCPGARAAGHLQFAVDAVLPCRVRTRSMLGLALLAGGCVSSPAPSQPAQPAPESITDESLGLPPAPDFPELTAPARYDDGSWSIRGLREDLDAQVKRGDAGEMVDLWVYVQEVYAPPNCEVGRPCPVAKTAHMWVTDHPGELGKAGALMVAEQDFAIPKEEMWEGARPLEFVVGQRVHVRGVFLQLSSTGFAHDRGLLEFRYLEVDGEWQPPPAAPWHPLVIEVMEAENRRMQLRMQREAEALLDRKAGNP